LEPRTYTIDGKKWVLFGFARPSRGGAKRHPNGEIVAGTITKVEVLFDPDVIASNMEVREGVGQGAIAAGNAGKIGLAATRNLMVVSPLVGDLIGSHQKPIYQITVGTDDGTSYLVQQEIDRDAVFAQPKLGAKVTVRYSMGVVVGNL
jgi:hypothetical protein